MCSTHDTSSVKKATYLVCVIAMYPRLLTTNDWGWGLLYVAKHTSKVFDKVLHITVLTRVSGAQSESSNWVAHIIVIHLCAQRQRAKELYVKLEAYGERSQRDACLHISCTAAAGHWRTSH